ALEVEDRDQRYMPSGIRSSDCGSRRSRLRSGLVEMPLQDARYPRALFGGVVSLDLINGFATNRTKPNMKPTNGCILLCDQHRSRGGLHPLKVLKVSKVGRSCPVR